MSYSIFDETMADMTYQDIERAAEQQAIVLFPIAVIEEHGPHLCLGTDTYLTYSGCKKVKHILEADDIPTLIAPPFYWGINNVTGAFPGSFTVRMSTMQAILVDLFRSLNSWGLQRVFTLNFHGDFHQNQAILKAIHEARIDYGVRAFSVLPDFAASRLSLEGMADYVLIHKSPTPDKPPQYLDVHAGANETGLMALNFPDVSDLDCARTLPPSNTGLDEFQTWRKGWSDARKVTPQGYCGNPADFDLERAKAFDDSMVEAVSDVIKAYLNGTYRALAH